MTVNTYWNEEYFPNSSDYTCPPKTAKPYIGNLFRFSQKSGDLSSKDYELASSRINFRNKNQFNLSFLCQGSGLSSFKSEEAGIVAHDKTSENSRGFREKFKGIYKIRLVESDGVVASTPSRNSSKHCTWWVVGSKEDLLSKSVFVRKV